MVEAWSSQKPQHSCPVLKVRLNAERIDLFIASADYASETEAINAEPAPISVSNDSVAPASVDTQSLNAQPGSVKSQSGLGSVKSQSGLGSVKSQSGPTPRSVQPAATSLSGQGLDVTEGDSLRNSIKSLKSLQGGSVQPGSVSRHQSLGSQATDSDTAPDTLAETDDSNEGEDEEADDEASGTE
eukprot:Blabericola_migrator_1__6364@NODE_3209_length_1948_cov_8_602871_g2009_i0_p1_GENE_NODE_3209_length_1948_cov_8_602871_g2009_i0NODE_3209_length_1948_cov_8_602871_g2009_i0_p1_ORF_typecomplete_len185_score30_41_NODE_3209_length_1948_cov_8_602871_g2009_i0157711